ncbi:MAG TPA: M20/M25/M40 family metallo-hydrolase [Feifaniaceae bacterium]|nr:M20/M25/M40 family metallo-hydrolase [Feifaniaceae bacterium]
MAINRERLLGTFAGLVEIDSPSLFEKDTAAFIEERLLKLGFAVTRDDAGEKINGNCGNLYGYLEGGLKYPPLLLCAHMDTVEPCRNKRAVFHEDGTITSAGDTVLGADDCAGIAAILEAVESIIESGVPHRPIEALFTVAEEIYACGAKNVAYTRIRSKEAYVLDLAGPVGNAAYKAPTILLFTAQITGRAAHAGFEPEKGVHAVQAAARAVSQLNMGRLDGETTLNIGFIGGGTVTNIVPESCTVRGEIRSFSHEKALAALRSVEQVFLKEAESIGATLEFEERLGCRAYETAPDHPVTARYQKACGALGLAGGLEATFGGSDNNYLSQNGITGLVLATAMNRCHSKEEYTAADELYGIASLVQAILLEA